MCRTRSTRSEDDLAKFNPEIGSRIWFRKQIEITMKNDELKWKIEGLKVFLKELVVDIIELKIISARRELDNVEYLH